MDKQIAPYGTWTSPITAADVATGSTPPSYPLIVGSEVWWTERRPAEGGRSAIVAATAPGQARDLLPPPWNARTRVHEYGGRSYLPVPSARPDGGFDLVFANFADQRLYLVPADGGVCGDAEPVPLTPDPAPGGTQFRFADLILSPGGASPGGREIWCVRETCAQGTIRAERAIVAVPLSGEAADDASAIRVLVTGADFFAFPTPSPDGTRLAWINWDHPRMPWDGTELRVARLSDAPAVVADASLVIGGPDESVLAPWWRDDETLYAVSDRSGWWNLYAVPASGSGAPEPLCPRAEEFDGPLWQTGGRPFGVLDDGRIAVLHGAGELRLAVLDPATGALADLDLPYRYHGSVDTAGAAIVTDGAGPRTRMQVARLTADGTGSPEILAGGSAPGPLDAYLPEPRLADLPSAPNAPHVHAIVYPPASPDFTAPEGELPPYIVHVHGGPTSLSPAVRSLEKAYFTSRGIGIIDVNYGGSTGYGREYRNRLRGQWGIVDVDDAMNAVLALAADGEADRARLGIRGGSAGGWTTLAAVTTALAHADGTPAHDPVFAAAVSYFGVSDLRGFVEITHDFESRYLDSLIGALPEAEDLYIARSPMGHVSSGTCPVLLLQGLDDPIVPPAQSESIAADLAAHAIPYAYIAFEGESHGFRKAETTIAALEAELAFYGQVMGFEPPGVKPVKLVKPPA
jgi:dipeptidyl aminopeptidase/acylaminoacyl peptidase